MNGLRSYLVMLRQSETSNSGQLLPFLAGRSGEAGRERKGYLVKRKSQSTCPARAESLGVVQLPLGDAT